MHTSCVSLFIFAALLICSLSSTGVSIRMVHIRFVFVSVYTIWKHVLEMLDNAVGSYNTYCVYECPICLFCIDCRDIRCIKQTINGTQLKVHVCQWPRASLQYSLYAKVFYYSCKKPLICGPCLLLKWELSTHLSSGSLNIPRVTAMSALVSDMFSLPSTCKLSGFTHLVLNFTSCWVFAIGDYISKTNVPRVGLLA